jgi:hypothetical protein
MYEANKIEIEKRNRIRAALFAYAYEIENIPLATDSDYDALCKKIDTSISTGNSELDDFFRAEFSSETGMWIYRHPELDKIRQLFEKLTLRKPMEITSSVGDNKPPKMNVRDLTGKGTYSANMAYLASLGFNVVPGVIINAQSS